MFDEKNIEKLSLDDIKVKYPANFEKYKYVDSIIYGELPYILLGIDPKPFVKQHFYSNPNKTTGSCIVDNLEDAEKARAVIAKAINNSNFDMLRDNSLHNKEISKILGQRKKQLYYNSEIYIIECIKWLEHEHTIDSSFFLLFPDWFVEYHKKRCGFISRNDLLLALDDLQKEKDTLIEENNILKQQIDKLRSVSKERSVPTQEKLLSYSLDLLRKKIEFSDAELENLPKTLNERLFNNFFVTDADEATEKTPSVESIGTALSRSQLWLPRNSEPFIKHHVDSSRNNGQPNKARNTDKEQFIKKLK